jgi:hypothetical protein
MRTKRRTKPRVWIALDYVSFELSDLLVDRLDVGVDLVASRGGADGQVAACADRLSPVLKEQLSGPMGDVHQMNGR